MDAHIYYALPMCPDGVGQATSASISYRNMTESAAHQHKHQNGLRNYSRRKREARVGAGELDPELDFICKYCGGIYSFYAGRHELHLRVCKQRLAQVAKVPPKPLLPPPPPVESEVFPPPATTGE